MTQPKKPRKGEIISSLTPNAVVVEINGMEIRVAANKEENQILNAVMLAQGRYMIQKSIKHWEEMEETPTPRELKDIISGMRELVESTNIIYAPAEPVLSKTEKAAEPTIEDIPFSNLSHVPEVKDITNERTTGNPPEADGSRPESGLPGTENPT